MGAAGGVHVVAVAVVVGVVVVVVVAVVVAVGVGVGVGVGVVVVVVVGVVVVGCAVSFDRDRALELVRQARKEITQCHGCCTLADQLEAACEEVQRRAFSASLINDAETERDAARARVAELEAEAVKDRDFQRAQHAEIERLRARLALLEPVLEAAKHVLADDDALSPCYRDTVAELTDAVDAALASGEEGKP